LFVKLADNSNEVPPLKGKEYADFWLDCKDWERIKQMKEVLQVHTSIHHISALTTFLPTVKASERNPDLL